jgi:hypothetical protein
MQSGLSAYESIKAFSETDFTEDLMKIDVPTLSCTARMTRSSLIAFCHFGPSVARASIASAQGD